MKQCSQCGQLNVDKAKFCAKCGSDLFTKTAQDYCWRCGATIQRGDQICKRCGAELTGAASAKSKKAGNYILYTAIGILAAAILAAAVLFTVKYIRSAKNTESPLNTAAVTDTSAPASQTTSDQEETAATDTPLQTSAVESTPEVSAEATTQPTAVVTELNLDNYLGLWEVENSGIVALITESSGEYYLEAYVESYTDLTVGPCMLKSAGEQFSGILSDDSGTMGTVTLKVSDGTAYLTIEPISEKFFANNEKYFDVSEAKLLPYSSDPASADVYIDYIEPVISYAYASSELAEYNMVHSASRICDGSLSTAWVEGASGQGVGESITLVLESSYWVSGFTINAGYQKSSTLYSKNSRPAQITVSFSDGSSFDCTLQDVNGAQSVSFAQAVQTDQITITFGSVYSGYKYQDTAISEISLY